MSVDDKLVYENKAIMFSVLHARDLGMAMKWKPYKLRICRIFSNGSNSGYFQYAYPNKDMQVPKNHMFALDASIETELTCREDDDPEIAFAEQVLTVKAKRLDNIDSMFRCIGTPDDIRSLIVAINTAIGKKQKSTEVTRQTYFNRESLSQRQGLAKTFLDVVDRARGTNVMRRAIHNALAYHDARSRKAKTLAQRGAFRWLPVSGANDLTHGSWWLVFGSVGIVFTALVVVINKYDRFLSDDDSTLSKTEFVASWILMLISGVFSTLGSLAFVRAFHSDPPMRPVFANYYHLQSDELLASWLFVGATFPFIPYSLIFVAQTHYHSLIYLVALGFAIVATLGSLVFVRACYPSDREYKNLLLPLSKYFCCCASEEWRQEHFANDWIGGTWVFYWCSLAGTFVNVIIFIYTLAELDSLMIFVFGTSLLEMVLFLVGCAYYVAGSSSPEATQGHSSHHKGSDKAPVEVQVTTKLANKQHGAAAPQPSSEDPDSDDEDNEIDEEAGNSAKNPAGPNSDKDSSWSSAMNPIRST